MDDPNRTHASMFSRLRKGDEKAWHDFNQKYRPMMEKWARSRGFLGGNTDEIVGEVLVIIWRRLTGNWVYDPNRRFRSFLKTVLNNQATRMREEQAKKQGRSNHQLWELVSDPSAMNSLLDVLEKADDAIHVQIAINDVRQEANEQQWLAWHLTEDKNFTGKEAASQMGTSEGNVNTMKSRFGNLIQKRLRMLFDEQG